MLLAAPFPGYVGAKGVERNGVTWQVFLGVLDLPSICSKPVGRMTKISSRQLPEGFFCDRVWSDDRLSLTASEVHHGCDRVRSRCGGDSPGSDQKSANMFAAFDARRVGGPSALPTSYVSH